MASLSFPIVVSFAIFISVILPVVIAQGGQNEHENGAFASSYSPAASDVYDQTVLFKKSKNILIAHAVFGILAWVLFAPIGAIVLRLNIVDVNLLKLHGYCQLFAYSGYIAAVGLGISLTITGSQYRNLWTSSHVVIGLLIFGLATTQPVLGYLHHMIFKRHLTAFKLGVKSSKKPGRTLATVSHIWTGRILILLGVVNAGLGIRLASASPFQTPWTSRKAEIGYGVVAAAMFLLYAVVMLVFEYRRVIRIRNARQGAGLLFVGGGQQTGAFPCSSESSSLAEKSLEIGA